MDKRAIDLIGTFNALFDLDASMAHQIHFGDDLVGVVEYHFYKQLPSQQNAELGTIRYKLVGTYQMGDYFKDIGFTKVDMGGESDYYPIGSNAVSSSSAAVLYKNSRRPTRSSVSVIPLKRWWLNNWAELVANNPDEAKAIEALLLTEIIQLGKVATARGYKSGWAYHRYMDKLKSFEHKVNNEILAETSYFYCPYVFYQQFSVHHVQMNDAEKSEAFLRSL